MSSTTKICIRVDTELKAEAEALFSELGMNLTTAVTVFLRQAVRESRIPFEIRWDRPNKDTMAAMRDAGNIARDPKIKGYEDPEELFRELEE